MPQPYRIVDLQSGYTPTGNELMEISNGGNGSYQVTLAQIQSRSPVTLSTAQTYNLSPATYGDILVTTTGAVIINMPDSTLRGGVPASIIAATSSTPNITINANGAQKLIGQSSLTIGNPWGAYTLWPLSTGGWYQK